MKIKTSSIFISLIIVILGSLIYVSSSRLSSLDTALVGKSIPTPDSCLSIKNVKSPAKYNFSAKLVILRDVNVSFEDSRDLPPELKGKRGFDTKLSNTDLDFICKGISNFSNEVTLSTNNLSGVNFTDIVDYRSPVNYLWIGR